MNFKKTKIPLYIVATLLFGLKTYIVYRFLFSIELENSMQEFILFVNPFISAFLVFAISVWFKKEARQMKFIRYSALIGTIIIYFNLVFYRSFTDFITVPQLFQASNMGDLGGSILTLTKPYDILLIVDVLFIWYLSRKKTEVMTVNYPRNGKVFALAMSLMLLAGNFFLAEMERPQLFTRAFDREYIVKNIGLFNYHIYDIALHSKVKSQSVFADGNELPEIKNFIKTEVKSEEKSEMFAVAKDKNVIFISAESVQNFVINNKVNGEEITPFLNSLVKDEDTYYFDNFYHQTGQGKTSDSEFVMENSLYPLPSGAVFFTHGQNEYNALPKLLNQEGYYTSVLHANNKSFWNRDQMYDSLGYDHFYGEEAYEATEENSIGWGLKDKPFFEQSIKYLQAMDKPFYSKFITLTNHFPFDISKDDRSIEPYNSNSNTLNNYFPTVRYTDEAIEKFFQQLKDNGLYEDSIIIIMGDHYGISESHNKAMSQYLGKEEITPYDHIQLQEVPFFIHIPNNGNGKTMSQVAGQIDIKPTLLSLLGIKAENDIQFGNRLFIEDRKGYIAFRNGDYASEKYISTNDTCYNRLTGEVLSQAEEQDDEPSVEQDNPCTEISDQVNEELQYSDDIVYGDLFRFVNFDEK
ncbi:LTA synthase family protein [Virgibacillus sp. DJP39]|uniref:LTA synthase family protein n=1 Tax=Virgibacillus sp. DJP39 TaxID=3409790 RepID=UPI003BB696CF